MLPADLALLRDVLAALEMRPQFRLSYTAAQEQKRAALRLQLAVRIAEAEAEILDEGPLCVQPRDVRRGFSIPVAPSKVS